VLICANGFGNHRIPVYAGTMTGKLAEKIKAIRCAAGLGQTEFGERMGVSQSTVVRWERGSRPQSDALHRIAEFANTTIERLMDLDDLSGTSPGDIPVVGYVGAGAEVFPYDDYAHGEGLDHVERPPTVTGRAVAVEVRGDSLLPTAENGWRLVYTGEQTIVEDEVLNRICVVQLADGRMLVKRIMRGSRPQRYHLVSTNAPIIEDVEILWAARVKAIIPR
jgi:transcriptional regulator with XRE-family HTH domain